MPKLISKFITVALSGKTVDGREISVEQINQMANNYDPKKYGARIWIEHFRSLFPDGAFPALGDVVALKAEDGPDGTRALKAQLKPNDKFFSINKENQKIFTSIEMTPNFSDTGEAYLTGLAITDSPASLGTEVIALARKSNETPSEALATELSGVTSEPMESANPFAPPVDEGPSVFSKVKDLLSGQSKKADANYADISDSVLAIAEAVEALKSQVSELKNDSGLTTELAALDKRFSDLDGRLETLSNTADPTHNRRPENSGGDGTILADC